MSMYMIYDNLYEKFQQPFFLPDDNVAKMELLTFKNAKIKELTEGYDKIYIKKRFFIYKFNGVYWDEENKCFITNKNKIKLEPIELGNEEEQGGENNK